MTIPELVAALRAVSDALDRSGFATASATRSVEEARAALLAVRHGDDGWYPVELDVAVTDLDRAGEMITRARHAVTDYLMRL